MDFHLYRNLIIKNEDDFVKESFQLPQIQFFEHACRQPVYHVVKNLISRSILEMICAENIEGAVKALGGTVTSNLYDLIEREKKDCILECKMKIEKFDRLHDEAKAAKWKQKLEKMEKDIDVLRQRFQENFFQGAQCMICLEDLSVNPVLLVCCQNVFCGGCIMQWIHRDGRCPLCRKSITSDFLVFIRNTSVKDHDCSTSSSDSSKAVGSPRTTKAEKIREIIMEQPDFKFIIFSAFDESFALIRHLLQESDICFTELRRGSMDQKYKKLVEFKDPKSDINVLFLNSVDSGAGLNLQEADAVILFHEMSEAISTQIIARAHRLGRTKPLFVHSLKN